MAYVVWRVLMKKYSKVRLGIQRNPQIMVKPFTKPTESESSWTQPSKTDLSSLSAVAAGLEDAISVDVELGSSTTIARSEIRRSKSKVRSYLKKCKNAIIGTTSGHTDNQDPITHHEPISQQSATSSWYLDEISAEEKIGELINQPNDEELTTTSDEDAGNVAMAYDCSTTREEILDTSSDSHGFETNCGVANLVDRYLGHLYPEYLEHTRPVLIRQARDLLVCTFHGDLTKFEEDFLAPAATIIDAAKTSCCTSETTLPWRQGWPLTVSGAVVLHLGALDESLLRPHDIYICIRPNTDQTPVKPQLSAVWRSGNIIYHPLNPDKNQLSPIALEMLAEDLPNLLQSLLIGVEHTINRVSLDELSFPHDKCNDKIDYPKLDQSTQNKLIVTPAGSPKCGIKRRELITKNKLINKLALKRIATSKSDQTMDANRGDDGSDRSVDSPEPVSMPLFCLGGSFPHIDSDEDSCDDSAKNDNAEARLPHDIVAPRSIQDLPEKLLTSGIYLPGTHDLNGSPIIQIEAENLITAGVNCYEIATVLLYYSTIPLNSCFTIHTIATNTSQLAMLDLLDTSLHLLHGHVKFNVVLVSCLFKSDKPKKDHLPASNVKLVYVTALSDFISNHQIPKICGGTHEHNQTYWREFFANLEPLQNQCLAAGRRLVSVMGDIRSSDSQGVPSRRQLYSQHRALSRALMDPELQNLRRKGHTNLSKLKEIARRLWGQSVESNCGSLKSSAPTGQQSDPVSTRLCEVITIFDEVDRAAKRLEQLTEQRRERLRELTRQRALEDEMNEVISWIRGDGENTLNKFTEIPLECEAAIKDHEQEFEKFYFISVKHLAKGRDLQDASIDANALQDSSKNLNENLASFSDRLETTRERIEGAARLHHLLSLHLKEDDVQNEMQRLAEKIGAAGLVERCKENKNIKTSTPQRQKHTATDETFCRCWPNEEGTNPVVLAQTMDDVHLERNLRTTLQDDDEEDHSKMADSGLGGCDRCEENDQLVRSCSCQSFEDQTLACGKSNNSDDLEDDCYESNSKQLDFQAPMQPNAHLYSYESSLDLPPFENCYGLDPKTQKTLLFIMREMIGTERDYVRSLHYIIENYTEELNREDIPQAMRGQRNVIFGNVEKICEFHQQHFLHELERCEGNPLKVGAAFLEHESKFYLYALYNKNKPKSDSLMSEYGSSFFKSKQIELDDKMDLASYLLKPVQRMGKYALLLQQLMKAVTSVQGPVLQEISEDVEELQRAEEMVRFQLRHGNDLLAMDSLRDCDVNVKEQGRLLRQNEFLVWQGRGGKKALRQVFLFEELVLFSKARRFPDHKNLDIYLYKNSIKTSDIGLTAHIGDTPKFEIWFRKRKPEDTWTLQSMSEDIKNAWTEEISKLLWKQAKRNREIRMAEMSSMGIGNKPCLDIRPSQNQISDRSITFSQLEKAPKFRNSFSGTLPEMKSARRPNSLISLGSSFSSGTSSSSLCTSTSSSNGSHSRNTGNMTLELINETKPLQTSGHLRKHQRSTTLVSQLSMESGIIADMSMSPDAETNHEQQLWSTRKSNSSTASTTQQTDQKPTDETLLSTNNMTDPYATVDSIAVHL